MQRRHFLQQLCTLAIAGLGFSACARSEKVNAAPAAEGNSDIAKLDKSLAEWRSLLAPQAYAVLFEEATERPFSSQLNDEKRAGTFICAACYLPLFESSAKFDSGTGWPSFFQPLPGHLDTKTDYKLIWPRTEYHCVRCGGHQGHVFDDGPPPTGQRWCNNGVALNFVPSGDPLPALRM
ncbi:MAG TPA: peptide-methionine (R)-S-oxide reductase MsrB [Candidatus Binatia bacterium]|nr:peptide-methionine (R)-S-oxide reductase MsrB [Candidatus Binatia bacterium]